MGGALEGGASVNDMERVELEGDPIDAMWLPLRGRTWPEGRVSLPGLPF
jgi:hypothetical protein